MAHFVRKLFLFFILQAILFAVVAGWTGNLTKQYLAAIIDKHHRARSVGRERLFFVGGSNVAFGVDSRVFAEALPHEPVNLGLHAGLGLGFMLNEVESLAKRGDIIVLSPEFEHFCADISGQAVVHVLELSPGAIAYIEPSSLGSVLDRGLVAIRNTVRSLVSIPRAFSRAGFNEYGDFVAHHPLGSRYEYRRPATPLYEPEEGQMHRVLRGLGSFAARNRERGVRVFYAYPPIARTFHQEETFWLDTTAEAIGDGLDMPILNRFEDQIYSDSLFYDSGYHLTLEGKRRRSESLLAALFEHLAHLSVPSPADS
jgi:hypothetical protein